GAGILAFGGEARYPAVGAAAGAAAAGIVTFLILKRRIGRRRPSSIEPHCWATLLPPDQFSFPSGHTITAFAVSVPIAHYYPAAAVACLFAAASVAVSRIVLGMHFLSDVVAGGVIGCVLGYAAVVLLG
ncbi:MAG TPA: phosphatase PAP2 family protein, partial [Terriglobia bacterium]|nr:phosphatase PAP2 family protein [Terriglobia bacterium]